MITMFKKIGEIMENFSRESESIYKKTNNGNHRTTNQPLHANHMLNICHVLYTYNIKHLKNHLRHILLSLFNK